MKYIISLFRKICLRCCRLFILISVSANADIINPKDTEPPIVKERIFQNRSILSCGQKHSGTVLTYLDVKALLVISNTFSQNAVQLTTDWQKLNTIKINLNKISSSVPQDILRVLFLCLNWEDTKLANLYNVAAEELIKHVKKIKKEKPWKIYPLEVQQQINRLSEAQLTELVHMVLRAERNKDAQGSLFENPSVKSIPYEWLL